MLVAFGLIVAALRAYATFGDRSRLPTRDYRMFAGPERDAIRGHLRVRLLDEHGRWSALLPPRRLLPVAAGHAANCFAQVFRRGTPEALRQRFATMVLDELNARPWRQFGERWSSPEGAGEVRFVGMEVVACRVELGGLADGSPEILRPGPVIFEWHEP